MATPSCTMEQPQVVVEETVVADTIPPVVIDYGFPDTMYASAEKVMFVVDTFDKSVPCMLSDFEDLYEDAPGIFMFRGSPTRNPNFFKAIPSISTWIGSSRREWTPPRLPTALGTEVQVGLDNPSMSNGQTAFWHVLSNWTTQSSTIYVRKSSLLPHYAAMCTSLISKQVKKAVNASTPKTCWKERLHSTLCLTVIFM